MESITDYRNKILQGDAIENMTMLRSKGIRVHSIINSPPYFGVRNYKVDGQFGQEATYKQYLDHLWSLFDQAWHVLHDHGTLIVNLGDTMNGNKEGNTNGTGAGTVKYRTDINNMDFEKRVQYGIPDKSYMMIPERFAIGMTDRGWVLRSKLIWVKKNVRPESQDNRFTLDHEFLYFFAKSNNPLFWTNDRQHEMMWKKPLGIKGMEDVDWFWLELDADSKTVAKLVEYEKEHGDLPPNFKKTQEVRKTGGPISARMDTFLAGESPKSPESSEVVDVYWRKWTLWRSHDYYFDIVYEPYSPTTIKEFKEGYNGHNVKDYAGTGAQGGSDIKNNILKKRKILFGGPNKADGYGRRVYSGEDWNPSWKGRLKRCVWRYNEYVILELESAEGVLPSILDVNTRGFRQAHFAVYPVELIEILVKACVPEYVCPKCGWMSYTIYDEERINTRPGNDTGHGKSGTADDPNQGLHTSDLSKYRQQIIRQAKGYRKCSCNVHFEPGIVLDPFMGSGTTALAALQNGRDYIGFELKPSYIKIAEGRIDHLRNNRRMDMQ